MGIGSGFVPTATIPQNILKKVKVIRDDARAIIEMATSVLRPALSTAAPRPLSAAAARVEGAPAAAQWACAMCVQKSMHRPRESTG